ncbi:MAG: hypothetical protein SGARI_004406, partial [Bacillariaceae sp.]
MIPVLPWLGGILAAVFTARYAGGLYAYIQTEKLERPSYEVIANLADGVELRRYEPYIIAETTVNETGFREAGRAGFFPCAEYIFGKNKARKWGGKNEKMSMTAPVRLEGGENKNTKVSFVIGSNYTLKTVPKPLENKIKLRRVSAHTLAVRSFSGPPPKDARVLKEREKLVSVLADAGISIQNDDSTTLVYGFHDPFITPNILRRNEVA